MEVVVLIVPEQILSRGCDLFGLEFEKAINIGGNDGAVYSVSAKDGEYILKFVYTSGSNIPVVLDKIAFINYLGDNGVGVASYLPSISNNIIETLETDTMNGNKATVIVSKHRKALGKHLDPRNPEDWAPRNFRAWGSLMGRMHTLTKSFTGGSLIKHWNDEIAFMISTCNDDGVIAKWHSLEKELSMLSKGPDEYGLIHNDLHSWNFFVNDGQLTIFDFDVCTHHWFMTDIAITLDAVIHYGPYEPAARNANAQRFIDSFLEGYSTENTLSREWLIMMPMFLRYRQMLLYSVKCADDRTLSHWRDSIIEDRPIVELIF
jgi:Ser/Thr protein kinase RdoA (MazF antagonist)